MNRLGTKAETLCSLYQKLKYAEVLPQYTLTLAEWKADSEKVVKGFLATGWKRVIVRSSSLLEDTSQGSQNTGGEG